MKIMRNEEGQTLLFTALLMAVLMGFMALAIDVGVIFRTQRNMQTAADAAATAAAVTERWGVVASSSSCGGSVGTVTCAAITAATNNGVSNSNQVTVNLPPVNGWHTGVGYVEVIIQKPTSLLFMGSFKALSASSDPNPMTVAARAVAGYVPNQACVYALDATAVAAFDVSGNANVSTPNCSIQVNSNSQQALCTTGSATITSSGISIVGAQSPAGKCNGTQSNVQTGVAPMPDPLAGLPWPDCDTNNTITDTTLNGSTAFKSKTETTSTGTTATVYCFSSNVTIASGTTLGTPGGNSVFVFQNGVTIGGNDTVNGTIDVAGGTFTKGNALLNLTAPANTSYTYNGLGLIVPPGNTSNTCGGSYSSFAGTPAPGGCIQLQFGSGYGNLDGMIYAPKAAVYMQDNGGGTVVTGIIADEVYDKSSNLEITDNYSHVHASTTPLNHVTLVE
ncbi:MAG TPA: pilus assembly protein TadG-related protein [Terracidiphilus sp.]|nr:pilus assembly protein TadG-related protein [Terracidiphilus sp.]